MKRLMKRRYVKNSCEREGGGRRQVSGWVGREIPLEEEARWRFSAGISSSSL